jgi:hypothetical protein
MAFSKFLPRLEKEFADAGALDWHDEAKRQILLGSLNRTMSGALMNRGIPATFMGLVNRLHEISTDMDALNLSGSKPRRTQKPIDEMDWTPSVSVKRAEVESSSSRQRGERQRAKWVSKEELDRRRHDGLCLRCGRSGCRIATCPYLGAIAPESRRIATGSTTEAPEKPKRVKVKKAKAKKSTMEDSESSESNNTEELVTESESENE